MLDLPARGSHRPHDNDFRICGAVRLVKEVVESLGPGQRLQPAVEAEPPPLEGGTQPAEELAPEHPAEDAVRQEEKETLGKCLLDAGTMLGFDATVMDAIRSRAESRMSIYEHEKLKRRRCLLRELITGETSRRSVSTRSAAWSSD